MNRWSKSGVLKRLFEALQTEGVIRIRMEEVCLDSITVKVHPDGTGALKNKTTSHRNIPGRPHYQNSYGHRI